MLIGLTYDLRDDYRDIPGLTEEALAEFDSPETIAAIEEALGSLGYATQRIGNIRSLAARLVAGDRWDMVFNIAEGIYGRSREAQVPALLEAYGIPYTFSDPLTQSVTLDKAVAKRLARDAGVITAPFITVDEETAGRPCLLAFPVFVKPIAEGTGKGCELTSKVWNNAAYQSVIQDLRSRFNQPVIVEPYLPGREFTVGIIGTGAAARVIAVLEVILLSGAEPGVYSYVNKEECETKVLYQLAHDEEAEAAGRTALAAYRALGCRDAARVDLRSDRLFVPHFLEVNTVAGMHPSHSDLPILAAQAGLGYRDLIAGIMASACARHGLALPEPTPSEVAA
jgi:D-alanine-D-alanine ligase